MGGNKWDTPLTDEPIEEKEKSEEKETK